MFSDFDIFYCETDCCIHDFIFLKHLVLKSDPEVIKLLSCSTQMSTEFQLLINTKYQQIMKFLALGLSDVVFIMLINVKMPTIVDILTLISRINFVLG